MKTVKTVQYYERNVSDVPPFMRPNPLTYVFGQPVVIATEAEDEVAGLPDVDAVSDVLEEERETLPSGQGGHVALGQSQVPGQRGQGVRGACRGAPTENISHRRAPHLSERDCSTSRAMRAIIFSRAAGRYFSSARDKMSSSSSSSSASSSDSTST